MPTAKQYRKYRRRSSRAKSKYTKRPMSYNTVKQIAQKVVMKNAETKVKDWNVGKVEYYHNTPQLLELNSSDALPTRGDGVDNRDGDSIRKIGTRHTMLIGGKWDRTNITYRLMYITYPRDATYSYGDFFINKTSNCLLDRMNTDRVKIIKTIYIKPQRASIVAHNSNTAGGGDKEYTIAKKVWLPSKSIIKFPSGSSSEASNRKFGVLISAYDAYGTLTSDNIAYVQHLVSNYYKDF
jgi:hypothetical protein